MQLDRKEAILQASALTEYQIQEPGDRRKQWRCARARVAKTVKPCVGCFTPSFRITNSPGRVAHTERAGSSLRRRPSRLPSPRILYRRIRSLDYLCGGPALLLLLGLVMKPSAMIFTLQI